LPADAALPEPGTAPPPRWWTPRRRWLGAIALLGGAIVIARALDDAPPAPRPATADHIAFVDVAGWYERTSHEVAVLTPFDLTLGALPGSLPRDLGRWHGVDRAHDPAVDRWFRTPEVSIERTYRRPDGEVVWLSAFGSRGPRSFHLFEHTPDTCYPLGGWEIDDFGLARITLDGPVPLTVNQGTASGAEGSLVFMYFYLWDTPARDAGRGVLSVRIAAPVRTSTGATLAMLGGEFLPHVFPATMDWNRF
jgi:hypothetical protein